MLKLDEVYLAEYSPQQRTFHIETAREMMESNLQQIVGGWTNSFLPFALCGSHDEASRACDILRDKMQEHAAKNKRTQRILGVIGEFQTRTQTHRPSQPVLHRSPWR